MDAKTKTVYRVAGIEEDESEDLVIRNNEPGDSK